MYYLKSVRPKGLTSALLSDLVILKVGLRIY